jgi:predicted dehydrogenase
MEMEPVRWGVLGVAKHYILRAYIPTRDSSLVEIYGIASREAEKAKRAAEKFGIPVSYDSYEKLLEDSAIEAVYIPLPNHLHAEWIRKTADAGKHILCEKPLTMSAGEAREVIEYAKESGVMLMEAFMHRFHPQWRRARDLTLIGEIGRVHTVHTYFTYNLTDPENIRNILEFGGGAIRDIGCYAVNVARFILDAEPKRVVSLITRDPGFGTDILSSALLDFGDARSLFTVATQTFPFQRVDIMGSEGRITIHLPFNIYPDVPVRVTVMNEIGTRELDMGPADMYAIQFEEFSRALRAGREVPTPPEDALNNQKVLDAILKSEKTGNWETV